MALSGEKMPFNHLPFHDRHLIEVDGISHDSVEAILKDQKRDRRLAELGFYTLRFSSWEVLYRMVDVDIIVCEWIMENGKVPPPGPRQREKK